jgi:hypothetical protein
MHATLPIVDEVSAAPTADDEVARALDTAKISTEGELLDALEHRRTLIGLSVASLDQLSGLAVGHSTKTLGPARIKSPTARTLFRLLDSLALSVVLLVDPSKADRVQAQWRPRHEAKVRVRRPSQLALQRSRPIIVAELTRKAAKRPGIDALTFLREMAGDT